MSAVSAISSTTTQQTAANTSAASSNITADYDTFLTLLVTQLKNQDPTAPTDNAEFIAQLASFSAVEQQTVTNDKLDTLMTYFSLDQGSALLGKQITSVDGAITGVVESVKITEEGVLATLKSGEEVLVQEGIEISDPSV